MARKVTQKGIVGESAEETSHNQRDRTYHPHASFFLTRMSALLSRMKLDNQVSAAQRWEHHDDIERRPPSTFRAMPAPVTDGPSNTCPKLYCPFKHGPNFIKMGIRKLSWDNWIEMDSYILRYQDTKASELKYFNAHVKYVDNATTKDACFEVYEELVPYLTHRRPKIFHLEGGKVYNTLISSIHTFDPSASCDDTTFQPCLSRTLSNHKLVIDFFRSIYTIYSGRKAGAAAAVGCYKEDTYQGGSAWYPSHPSICIGYNE